MAADDSSSALAADAIAQEEEREALCAIYGDAAVRWSPQLRVLTLRISGDDDDAANAAAPTPALLLELRILLPEDYPSRSPPVVEVVVSACPGGQDDDLPPAAAELAKEVDEACCCVDGGGGDGGNADDNPPPPLWSPGEVALFPLAERAREVRRAWLERQRQEARRRREERQKEQHEREEEQEQRRQRAARDDASGNGRPSPAAPPRAPLEGGCDPAHVDRMACLIVSGEPVVERKSAFQAHVAPVASVGDVKAAVAALLRVPKIRNCTHNIMAYRIRRTVAVADAGATTASTMTTTTWLADADDDGEDAAGGRLLMLLQSSGCEGVVVVVSRWFGGVLLGPMRFALINNTARALLVREGYIAQGGGGGGGKKGGGH